MLPVTITAPAELPFTTTFPSHVTVASGAAHTETFTLTNRLAAPVTFHLVGPCMFAPAAPCTAHPGAPLDEYWSSDVSIGADATVTMTLELSGTSDLEGPGLGNTPLAPGTYHFEGPGGMPLTLTVTP